MLSLLIIIAAAVIFINTEWGQNIIVSKVTKSLSKNLRAKVHINHVSFSLFNRMYLEDVLVEDQKKDTLLFAGNINVRITDWFFWKDKAELKYIGLENAYINLHRTDSVWNYRFLQDYFSGGGSSGKKEGIAFDLKKMELKNITLLKKDEWRGEDMLVQLKTLLLDADEINFSSKKAEINFLVFTEPFFRIKNYTGLRPKKITPPKEEKTVEEIKMDSLLVWNAAGWLVHIDKMKIDNGRFQNEKQSASSYYDHFDGRRIDFASIEGVFANLNWAKDTITALLNLKTKERSGFEVKSMVADAKFTPQGMAFGNLEIKTNNSIIRNYFAMNYDDMDDLGDYIHKVRMNAVFTGSEVDSDDIAFFAPALKTWKKKIKVSGTTRGTVDDLFGSGMNIEAGQNTFLNGDISLTGLPDIYQTFIDFKANNLRTTYGDAVTFLPVLRKVTVPNLRAITYLNFNGSFTGFLRDFVTFGTIRTNLGTVTSDLNMKLPPGKEPFYSGNIASDNFNLGQFVQDNAIGAISFSGQVKGKGVKWNSLSADMDMKVKQFTYNNYHYENITAKGILDKKVFNGNFSIKDSNAVAELSGIVDLGQKIPRYNFIAAVDKLNLKNLNITKENYQFTGKLDFDFSGNTIDDFLGDARIRNATVYKDGKTISVDSLTVSAGYAGSAKKLSVKSPELEAEINGNFSLKELPDAFQLFLNKYYPAYIKEPKRIIHDQAFDFSVKTGYISDYINLFDSSLQGFSNTTISGSLNTSASQMELKGNVPAFAYKDIQFQNVLINGSGDLQKLKLSGSIDQVNVSDSLNFPFTTIDLVSQNDLTDFKISTRSSNKNIPEGAINARVQTFSDGIAVRFDSSRFIMNGKMWTIVKDGELELRSNTVTHSQIVLRESNQEIVVKTVPSDIGNWNDVKIDLKNFNIGDVTPFFLKSNRVEGLLTGGITIEDPVNAFRVTGDIQADELRLDNDSIGQVKSHITYNNKTGELKANGKTLNPNQRLGFDMNLFLKDLADNTKEDVITIAPDNYPIHIIERFIGTLFTDLQGYVTGQLKITGKGENRRYVGKGRLHEAGLKVLFTQCFYKIPDTEIEFKEDGLDLGTLKLVDTITGNTATLTQGIIKHDSWKNMEFNIAARVDDKPMQLLNTTARDNKSFYGNARGTGSFSLTGPQSNMRMKIVGDASETDSSYITIPNTSSRESGIADFLIERKYGREISDTARGGNETNLTYDVDLTGNPKVNVSVVLDELTNDRITGRGAGNLRIISGTSEPLTMRGRYTINEGSYRFTFQSFFKKPFELKKDGNNYIEWNGDPYHPTVNIDAVYKTEKKVDFAPLITSSLSGSPSGFRDYVYVVAKLRGDLFKPDISFELDFPPDSPPKKDVSVSFIVNQLQNNENELNKHVAFLVVFNSFAPSDVGSTLGISSGVDLVVNSISGFLSSQINNVLNNILSNKLKIPGLYVNFSGSLYNPNPFGEGNTGFSYDRTNLNFSVGKSLFNNRVVLTFEGSYDVPFQSTTQVKSDLLSNFTTEFLINKSGTIRATIFYKENVDFLSGTSTTGNGKSRKYGGSLAYRRQFNKWGEFFGRKKNKTTPAPKPEEKKEGN